jgi:hypothetical protein
VGSHWWRRSSRAGVIRARRRHGRAGGGDVRGQVVPLRNMVLVPAPAGATHGPIGRSSRVDIPLRASRAMRTVPGRQLTAKFTGLNPGHSVPAMRSIGAPSISAIRFLVLCHWGLPARTRAQIGQGGRMVPRSSGLDATGSRRDHGFPGWSATSRHDLDSPQPGRIQGGARRHPMDGHGPPHVRLWTARQGVRFPSQAHLRFLTPFKAVLHVE